MIFSKKKALEKSAGGAGFTLVEIFIVIGVLIILSVVLILVLNPLEYLRQARDSNRIGDLKSINSALNFIQAMQSAVDWDGPNYTNSCATDSDPKIFVSIPSDNGEISPSEPAGWEYVRVSSSQFRKVDGEGWLPVDLTSVPGQNSSLTTLPVDPVNTFASGLYYSYVCGSYELNARLESQKRREDARVDGGDYDDILEIGREIVGTAPARPTPTSTEATSTPSLPAPTVSSATPNSRGQGATLQSIAIIGSNFATSTTASFGPDITVNSITFVNSTQLTATISIAANAATGTINIAVTNSDLQSGTCVGCFTVNAKPIVNSLTPTSSAQGTSGLSVNISGANFSNDAGVAFSGSGVTLQSSPTVNNSTSITVSVNISAGATLGARDVMVTNGDSGSGTKTGGFTISSSATTPGAPLSPYATSGNAEITVNWSTPSSDGGSAITGYRVWRSLSSGGATTTIGTTTPSIRGLRDSGVTNGTTYYYKIVALNSVGVGPASTEISAVASTTPSAPQSATTTAGDQIVNVFWSAPASNGGSAVTGYRLKRSGASGGPYIQIASTSPATTNYLNSFLVNGTTYYYVITAVNAVGEGSNSSEAIGTPTAPAEPPVATTTSVSSTTSSSARLNGNANPNNGATTGYFRYSTSNPGTCNDSFGTRVPASGGSLLGSGNTSVSYSENLSSLSANTTYYYCAIANNSAGTGFGTVISFTTNSGLSFVSASAISSSTITLPAFTAGNIAIAFAYRNGNTTPPSAASGWTTITSTSGANTNSRRISYRVLQSGDAALTFANATALQVIVLQGQSATNPVGASSSGGTNTTTMTLPALTVTNTGGQAWLLGFGGSKGTTANQKSVSGMTTRSLSVGTLGLHTKENNTGNFSAVSYSSAVDIAGNRMDMVEIIPN